MVQCFGVYVVIGFQNLKYEMDEKKKGAEEVILWFFDSGG